MTEYKDATILDIARELMVSKSTVSRTSKDHPSIGKKIKQAIQELPSKDIKAKQKS
ncbi:MAG TPA: hypothetical protein VK957_21645 [Lunatimonas sp.]|nr:hypothetical protein [Lunatimonas sp.]